MAPPARLALPFGRAPTAPWIIAGLGVDIRPPIPETVRCGGLIRANAAEPATVAEMRTALAAI